VSRTTIREASRELELNEYITKTQGVGTFVSKKLTEAKIVLEKPFSLFDWLKEKGFDLKIKILSNKIISPPEECLHHLDSYTKKVLYIERFMLIGSEPLYLAKAYFPNDIFKKIGKETLINNSFTKVVEEKFKIKILHKKLIIEADIPDKGVARLLRIKEKDKKVIEYMNTYWTIEYKSKKRIIYHQGYFHWSKGKFVFELDLDGKT